MLSTIVLFPVLIPLVLCSLLLYLIATIVIYFAVWVLWLPRGKHILFIYSESPIWHGYIEEHVIPVIHRQAIVLNWSQRRSRTWRYSLANLAFKHFGGLRDFNPMAVVFRPFTRARVFRFHSAFREYKHGKPGKLIAMQQDFLEYTRTAEHSFSADLPSE